MTTESKDINVKVQHPGIDKRTMEWIQYGKAFHEAMAKLRKENTTVKEVNKSISELRGRLIAARLEGKKSDLQYTQTISLYQQRLNYLRQLKTELLASEKAERDAGKASEVASKRQQKASKEAAEAQEKQGKGIARLIKQLVLWGAGSASLYYIWRKFRTTIINAAKEVYQNAESYAALTKEIKNTQHALVLLATDYSSTLELMEESAKFLQHVTNRLLQIDAALRGFATATDLMALKLGGVGHTLKAMLGPFDEFTGLLILAADKAGLLGETQLFLRAASAAAQDQMRENEDALAGASAETKDYSSQISSLVSRMRDFNRAAAEQAQAIREIEQAFKDASAVARGQYAAALMQIDIDLQKEITGINAKALEDRADAYEDYQDKLRDLQSSGAAKRKSDAERHALEMEFALRRHNLSLLQTERMYQYSRGLLVAEGDVLAIEDLDARYELEKQATEENFALQQQQAEAMFRLQAKIQEESMRRQIAVIQQGLREQLAEIEEGRREEIAEAEAGAKEKEAQAADEQATALAAAILAEQEETKAQKDGQIEREQALIDYFFDMGIETGIGFEGMLGIAKQYFDVGGSFDTTMKASWERQASYIQIFTDAIYEAANALAVLGSKTMKTGRRGGIKTPGDPRISSFAHGTDTVVSTPTPFIAGERGAERVVVQPLSPIGVGGNVSMSWEGGPIPIHGSGAAEGMDTAMIGNAIAQGIVDQMSWSFSSLRGSRGK